MSKIICDIVHEPELKKKSAYSKSLKTKIENDDDGGYPWSDYEQNEGFNYQEENYARRQLALDKEEKEPYRRIFDMGDSVRAMHPDTSEMIDCSILNSSYFSDGKVVYEVEPFDLTISAFSTSFCYTHLD